MMNIEDNTEVKTLTERTLVTEDSGVEMFPEVREDGEVVGKMLRSEAHCGTKRLHAVVHLHLFNSKGELYLQHRPEWKEIQPNRWDTACGGHVDYGETVREALAREVYEELGISPELYQPRLMKKYVFESKVERELVYVHSCVYDGEVNPSSTETSGGRFWSMEEIKDSLGNSVFTPMFEQEVKKVGIIF